ncbi:MAG: beta-galactosidase trimerization domain-containing protein [Lentisphaeria bacterium]|nr:beta-galactosidase trimerization domain-containing protein [Lentisphaeria bacterium]
MLHETSLPLVGASIGPGIGPLQDFQKLKLGNIVLIWLPDDKQEALRAVRYCRDHKIYIMLSEIVHRHNHVRWHSGKLSKNDLEEIIAEAGDFFLGRYAVGEVGGMLYWPKCYVIGEEAGAYPNLPPCRNETEAHAAYVDYIREQLAFEREKICDCPLFSADSSILFPYLTEAGIDGQCIEMLPGDPLLTLSAVRGASRAANMVWGVHIAMLWYGGIRMDELWLRRWRIALWTAFISGADFIYPESGHLDYHPVDSKWFEFNSPELLRIRRELRALYQFTQVHTRPSGGPLTPAAVLQGQDDGHPGIWNPYAWGQYENGREWETSDAEKGWELFDALFRREDVFHENVTGTHNDSGNPPCGQIDVIPPSADFTKYSLLLLIGYNRMDDALYDKLIRFVENGGHLVLWLSHFDNAEKRGDPVKLYRGGDLSELCGFKVSGRGKSDVHGMKFVQESSFPEYDFPVRGVNRDPYFIGHAEPAEIEIADPSVRVLAVFSDVVKDTLENSLKRPLLTERRLGKGAVFTVTAFTKPGACGMRKFGEVLIRSAAKAHLTDLECIAPDMVRRAVYSDGKDRKILYLLNCDPDLPQAVRLRYRGRLSEVIPLSACEFKAVYVDSGILLIPSDPLAALHDEGGKWNLDTNAQTIELENLSGSRKEVSVNGISLVMESQERKAVACPARIPEEKACFLNPGFLDEPEMDMEDKSTPY